MKDKERKKVRKESIETTLLRIKCEVKSPLLLFDLPLLLLPLPRLLSPYSLSFASPISCQEAIGGVITA